MSEPRMIELDPALWARGGKGYTSYEGASNALINPDGTMCCLGVACVALGVEPGDIGRTAMPHSCNAADAALQAVNVTHSAQGYLANTNDNQSIDDEERLKRLNDELSSVGAGIRFQLKTA